MDIHWLTEPYVTADRSHAYTDGATRSLCGQMLLPVEFVADEDVPRCGNCQRVVIKQMTAEQSSAAPDTERWREIAVRAALGEHWTYEEIAEMPSHRAEVDRVAVALAEAFREGLRAQTGEPT